MIARVFPSKSVYSPDDPHAYFSAPDLFVREYDEIRISCPFTWLKKRSEWLYRQWDARFPGRVILGGPAYLSPAHDFEHGMYVHKDVIFTSRGCPNACGFCSVPRLEGELKELRLPPDEKCGWIVNDNNFLACSRQHKEEVYEMLRRKGRSEFRGGLESRLLTEWDAEQMCSLPGLRAVWLACDTPSRLRPLRRALDLLRPLKRRQKMCYMLIGHKDASVMDAWDRIVDVVRAGATPHPQLFRPWADVKLQHPHEWKLLQSAWCNWASASGAIKLIDAGDDAGLAAYRDEVLFAGRRRADANRTTSLPI